MTATVVKPATGTPAPVASNPALLSLTSLRFFAAIAVFGAHAALEILFLNQMIGGVLLFGVMPVALSGVSYFFLLSGFVLTWSHKEDDTARKFWRRRFWRVYPNHLAAYLLALVLMVWAGHAVGLWPAVAQLSLVQSWFPNPEYYDTINSLSWSLSVEVFCYLLFPVLIRVVKRIRPERLWYAVGALVTVVLTIPVVADLFLPEDPAHPLGDASMMQFLTALNNPESMPPDALGHASIPQVWFVYHLPIMRFAEFALGMLIARIVLTKRWIGLRPMAAAALLIAVYVADVFAPYLYQLTAVAIIPMILLLGAVAASEYSGRTSLLQARPLVWFGDLTFAFYLLHGVVLIYGHLAFGTVDVGDGPEPRMWPTLTALGFIAGAFVVSMAGAWVLHNFVEKPAMRRFSRARPAAVRPVSPGPVGEPQAEPAGRVTTG